MQVIQRISPLLLILSLLLLFQGCTAPVTKPDVEPEKDAVILRQQADSLIEAKSFAAAAVLIESLARDSLPPRRENLLLEAAENWAKAGNWEKSESLTNEIRSPGRDAEFILRLRMLQAERLLQLGQVDQALDLMQPPPGPESSLGLRQRFHKNVAESFRLVGNLLESARELGELDILLLDPERRLKNQAMLIQTLSAMTDTALALLQPDPPGTLGGWMDLARIVKNRGDDPAVVETRLDAWREEYQNHPALPALLVGYFDQDKSLLEQVSHIAILLPRTGPYAKVAAAARDGFMAAWYQRPANNRPELRFYDSSDPTKIIDIYQLAIDQGAKMAVGPISKAALKALLQKENFEIPLLALNRTNGEPHPSTNFYQFGLSPEDEAEQVAERAWLDGLGNALVLTPTGSWGDRIYESFRERWESLGGRAVEQQSYIAKENDFSTPIRKLLNIDESNARKQAVQRVLGGSLEHEPRRRADADFIFLAARPQKARQLRPQLQFHHAGDLPVYATSHIYSGKQAQEKDKDIGKIKFVDIPWLLEDDHQQPLSRSSLAKLLPGVEARYTRLYAMGIDAFNLLPHLQQLSDQPGLTQDGKTGNLYIDASNRLHRQLAWAEMANGKVSISGFAPRMEVPENAPSSNHPIQGLPDESANTTTDNMPQETTETSVTPGGTPQRP